MQKDNGHFRPAASPAMVNAAVAAALARGLTGTYSAARTLTGTRTGRNDPCPCGSGRKYKKCCLAAKNGHYSRDPRKLPKPRLDSATVMVTPEDAMTPATGEADGPASTASKKSGKNAVAASLLSAGVAERIVYAYLATGVYLTEISKQSAAPDVLAKWEAAMDDYDRAPPAWQQELLAPARE